MTVNFAFGKLRRAKREAARIQRMNTGMKPPPDLRLEEGEN